MKTIILYGTLATIASLALLTYGHQLLAVPEYVAPQKEIVEIEKKVEVSELEARIKAAQAEHETEIKTKAQEAYDSTVAEEMRQIEIAVRAEYVEAENAKLDELKKQSAAY